MKSVAFPWRDNEKPNLRQSTNGRASVELYLPVGCESFLTKNFDAILSCDPLSGIKIRLAET